jgi:hypothetical protein
MTIEKQLQIKIAEAICENDKIIIVLTKEESATLQKMLFDLDALKSGLEELCLAIEEHIEPNTEVYEVSEKLYEEFLNEK